MMLGKWLKAVGHRWVDPIVAWWRGRGYRAALKGLADGEYMVKMDVPYVPQFASRELIYDYIHLNYDGKNDPKWESFGSENVEDYAFWSHRVCALACLKMAIGAYQGDTSSPSLWELVQEGLELGGYRLRDEEGNWIDEGWYVAAQVKLAERYGLKMIGHSYASPLGICKAIRDGYLVAATVTPELGERVPQSRRYGGHLVMVVGFRWKNGKPTAYCVHNPSGRYVELQEKAWIGAKRFRQSYAYRFATYEKAADVSRLQIDK